MSKELKIGPFRASAYSFRNASGTLIGNDTVVNAHGYGWVELTVLSLTLGVTWEREARAE